MSYHGLGKMKKVVRTDRLTDPDLLSLIQRVEGIIEGYLNSSHTIISVNYFENAQPFMAIISHFYEQQEPQNEHGW